MTEEQKAADAAAEKAKESEAKADDKDIEKETDYEAIALAERERADKAEKLLAGRAFKEREAKREEPGEADEPNEDDKPLTAKQLQTILARERQTTQKTFEETRALEIARANTSSEQEAQAALVFWRNRVVPTGDLNEDITFAIAGLNHRKTVAKNAELARALKGRDGISQDIATTQRDTPESSPRIDAQTEQSYTRAGFSYDAKLKSWKKKLPNGKFLIKDPRTKKTTIL